MLDLVPAEIGPIDILANNAGSYPCVPWQDTNEAAWNYSLDVDLTAHYRTCHAVTPGVNERGWGRIVNIGSVNARAGRTNLVAYSTAKAGLLGLTRSLASDSASLAVDGPKTSWFWWRSSWAPPPRSSLANPSPSTVVDCCTETVNKQGDRPK
ncbi:hypothetical protein GCM10010425_29710 [Streptomyces spororaveus]|uniref:Uncharacterized protein n=1 Tax=Streptomyces spororaveus TaxID=284039 RepID=A0ABQ3T5X4_9ACTN|nr:SDR family NAD(P)-dependent oxidoreductase [Streptomyces spororaveus]GHI75794.1 hypothetical protein Sspor_13550 [Streptomyces spororaveus]